MRLIVHLLLGIAVASVIRGPGLCQGDAGTDFSGAKWIWHPNPDAQTVLFRKVLSFDRPVEKIEILISADDSYELWINGRMAGSGDDPRSPQRIEVPRPVAREESAVAVRARNSTGAAGLICRLSIYLRDGGKVNLVSDETWRCSEPPASGGEGGWNTLRFDDNSWERAAEIGTYPCEPWGRIVKESWESVHARLRQRRELMAQAAEIAPTPAFSEFKSKYVQPDYAALYKSFVKLNRETGLLEHERRVVRPFFAVYDQPNPDGAGWIADIPDFDYNLLEKDFALMKQAEINVRVKSWNWSGLLNYDGTWKQVEKQPKGRGLPYFKYVYQIYDYFLDRAQAHGLYVSIQPSLSSGLHPEVVPPQYRGKILLYDELWDAAESAYAKILRYYGKRTVIVTVTIGGDDLTFDRCLDEPAMGERFKRYLRKTYGTISSLKRAWRHGYDYSDRSGWTRRTINGRDVLWPEYPFVEGSFDSWDSFEDARLPLFDYCRSVDLPDAPLSDLPTRQENLLRDPAWVDFTQMREELMIARLNDLADALRDADPNHILYYCSGSDFGPAWQSARCFDRGKLRFDVIGTGHCDADPKIPGGESCCGYVQNIASCGPYLAASEAYPKGLADGESGGTCEGAPRYELWWLTDLAGGGVAFFHGCEWSLIAGRTHERPLDHDSVALNELGGFLRPIRNAAFTYNRNAQVLILRGKHAADGMSAGCDFANARRLASILYQLHIPFDILPDSDVTPGAFERGKVNLGKYRFIFVPAQNQLLSGRTWQMLEDWIMDPRFAGRRGLCLGLYQDQDCYFNPAQPSDVHPAFSKLTGIQGYDRRMKVSGPATFEYTRFFGEAARGEELVVEFPDNGEIGTIESRKAGVEPILRTDEGESAVRNIINGNPVYTCGFYLGLAYDAMWGLEKAQNPYNKLSPLYLGMMKSIGLETPIAAPDNLGVYVSDDGSTILVKEAVGKQTDVAIAFTNPHGAVFAGTTTILNSDATVGVRDFQIEPYGVRVLRKAAVVTTEGGENVSAVCKATPEGGLECELSGRGKVTVTFGLKPQTIYSARESGDLIKVFTSDKQGRHTIAFDLGDGSKPLHLTIRPSKR